MVEFMVNFMGLNQEIWVFKGFNQENIMDFKRFIEFFGFKKQQLR